VPRLVGTHCRSAPGLSAAAGMDGMGGGAAATVGGIGVAALTAHVEGAEDLEPGSAMWHAKLFNRALEREGSRLSSRGSQRLGSSHSSRTALSSREGVRKGFANLRAAEAMTKQALADHEDAHHAHTARAKLQTTEPNSPGEAWRGKPGHRPSTTTGNPREARLKKPSHTPEGSAPAGRSGVGSPQRPSPLQGRSRDTAPRGSPSGAAEERVSLMTPADKQGMIQKSLTGFRRYFKEMPVTQVQEIPGPSSVQSASVEAYLEISGSDMSDEELLETLASRPGRLASQLKPHPKVPQNELFTISQRAERLDRHRRQKKGQGVAWGSPKKPRIQTNEGEQAPGVEFKSTGLLAHTELERLRTVDESRKNDKPERGRVAHCCSLLERLQVKYFDEELGLLKEELFRAIFNESEALKRMPVPRNRAEFLNAKPFFELWQQEKDRMDSLQWEIKKYKEEAEHQASVNQQLQARMKLLADLTGKGGGGGLESGARLRPKSPPFDNEAPLSQSMLRGSISTHSLRQSSQKLARKPMPEDALKGDMNWPIYAGTEPDTPSSFRSTRPQLQSMSIPASAKHMSFRSEARLVTEAKAGVGGLSPKDGNPFLVAVPRIKLVASEIDNFEEYLRMQRVSLVPGDGTDPNTHQGSHSASFVDSDHGHEVRNEGQSEHDAPHSMSTRRVLEENRTVEAHPGVEEGDEQENGTAKPPPGHTLVMGQKMRRRKGVHEARWRDFSIYLSRHREVCSTSKEKLNTEYDKWRFSFDYKAPFPAMLRALERHKQIEVVGAANDRIVYSESLGQDLEQSSDEEEDLEDVIARQERRIVKLQIENMSVKGRLEEEMATHTAKLEQRMEELERISDQIFESAKKNFEARVQTLQERAEGLEAQLREKEEEIGKVRYLLQDGDSLAAKLKAVTEESEQAAVRFARREKQLLDITLKDKDTIDKLQKQVDVADVIMKAGREQLKVKVGFHTQRMRVEEQTVHQEQLREIERLFQEKLELAELKGNVRQLTVKMSEKRFNVIMDILQRLDERIESLHQTQLGTAVSSSVFKSLDKQTKMQFSDARLRLLQQVTVDSYDSDSDAEYHNPEIGGIRTSEVQTDLTPANLGLEEPGAGGGKKKGKKGGKGKKGKKGKKAVAEDPLAPIDPEKVRLAQGLVDAVYQQLEPTVASSLGPPIVPVPDQVTTAVTDAKAGSGASRQVIFVQTLDTPPKYSRPIACLALVLGMHALKSCTHTHSLMWTQGLWSAASYDTW